MTDRKPRPFPFFEHRTLKQVLTWPPEFGGRKHAIDPGPKLWEVDQLPDESPEARAFRRFPINSHKPG